LNDTAIKAKVNEEIQAKEAKAKQILAEVKKRPNSICKIS